MTLGISVLDHFRKTKPAVVIKIGIAVSTIDFEISIQL